MPLPSNIREVTSHYLASVNIPKTQVLVLPLQFAFTLVELLIVMLIISVLAALLLPALSRAKERARQVVCLSNQRQIGLSFKIRVEDVGGRFDNQPELHDWLTNNVGLRTLPWTCPDATSTNEPRAFSPGTGNKLGTVISAWSFSDGLPGLLKPEAHMMRSGSFDLNYYLVDRSAKLNVEDGFYFHRDFFCEPQVQHPSATPFVVDGLHAFCVPQEIDQPPGDLFSGTPSAINENGMRQVAIPRHGGRPRPVPSQWPPRQPLPGAVNVFLYDGHGELIKPDRLWQLYWNVDWTPPDRRPGLAD